MKKVFVVYDKKTGEIFESGMVDRKIKADGSTVFEMLKRRKKEVKGIDILYLDKKVGIKTSPEYIVKNKKVVVNNI